MVDPALAWSMALAGAVLNFVGGMMMASGYLSITKPGLFWWRSVPILVEVWWPGHGRTAAAGNTFNATDNRRILRGIGLVVLGFALQLVAAFAHFPRQGSSDQPSVHPSTRSESAPGLIRERTDSVLIPFVVSPSTSLGRPVEPSQPVAPLMCGRCGDAPACETGETGVRVDFLRTR